MYILAAVQKTDQVPIIIEAADEIADAVSEAVRKRDDAFNWNLCQALASSPLITGLVYELYSGKIAHCNSATGACCTMDSSGTVLKPLVSSMVLTGYYELYNEPTP